MTYRWHKVSGRWESFHWRTFCIAAVLGYGIFFLAWILFSHFTTGQWNHRIIEGSVCALGGLIITVAWKSFRSTESPDFAAEQAAALRGKTDSPIDSIDLSDVLRIASSKATTVITVIQLLHIYDLSSGKDDGYHANPPWYTIWLYAGRITDNDEDDECEADDEHWVSMHATQLKGRWYDASNASAVADRIATALRDAGYEVYVGFFVGD